MLDCLQYDHDQHFAVKIRSGVFSWLRRADKDKKIIKEEDPAKINSTRNFLVNGHKVNASETADSIVIDSLSSAN